MAITQRLISLDAYYRATPGDKIIVNDISWFKPDDLETLNRNLMSIYDNTDILSTKPTCDCGVTAGRYLVGKCCSVCGTKCQERDQKMTPLIWLRAIDEDHLFINPVIWLMIKKLLSNKGDYLRYLCDTRYNPPIGIPPYIINIRDMVLKGERSYANTSKHLVDILKYLLSVPKYKDPSKQEYIQLLINMVMQHPDEIYSNYLPIINKKLFIVENTSKGKFINLASSDIIDVVMSWVKLCSENINLTPKQISSTMASVMSNISNLYHNYYSKFLIGKPGVFRKHLYGTRSHFTFRCVIVSTPGEHKYNEIVAPWAIGLTAFRPHIFNKLIKRGYNYKQANKLLFKSVKKYDPVISEILDELITETPEGKGIAVTQLRNPSLLIGSCMLMYIKAFKKDPFDYGVQTSQLVIKNSNGEKILII